MKHSPTSVVSASARAEPAGVKPMPLSAEEGRRLNFKTEREARRQAQVGKAVRGGVVGDG